MTLTQMNGHRVDVTQARCVDCGAASLSVFFPGARPCTAAGTGNAISSASRTQSELVEDASVKKTEAERVCECGAAKAMGVKNFGAGHSHWCPVGRAAA